MFNELWQRRREAVEQYLTKIMDGQPSLADVLNESMRYSLMAGGKRLRPIMLMAAADAVGDDGDRYLATASALEMIHTYSLIHDDLPAMDNDDFRRGKPTNHRVYGDATALLAGDALLTLAFETIAHENTDANKVVAVVREVGAAAGHMGMVGGQVLDLAAENHRIGMDELKKLHLGKTGALFRAAVRSGGILAGASTAELDALSVYAENFGLAFQITDDILDVVGNEKELGKPVGSDIKNHKSTYVSLTSLEEAKALAQDATKAAMDSLGVFGDKADFLVELARFLNSRRS